MRILNYGIYRNGDGHHKSQAFGYGGGYPAYNWMPTKEKKKNERSVNSTITIP